MRSFSMPNMNVPLSSSNRLETLISQAPSEDQRGIREAAAEAAPVFDRIASSMHARGASAAQIVEGLVTAARAMNTLPPYQKQFQALVASDPNVTARLLDIGCAGEMPLLLEYLPLVAEQIDG